MIRHGREQKAVRDMRGEASITATLYVYIQMAVMDALIESKP